MLASTDPTAHPLLDPCYFSDPADMRAMISGVRLTREIFAQAPFDPYRGAEIGPGAEMRSDAEIAAFVRETAGTAYHPVGTCKMGSGKDAVVDGDLRVHGLEGLRVVDSSIMPTVTSGNTNAPSLMIGEKAADIIRQKHGYLSDATALAAE